MWVVIMSLFHISHANPEHNPFLEFFRTQHLSCGVYRLSVGQPDKQQPHTEDEVYYVVEGRALIRVEDKDIPVESGSIVFVPANAQHQFHSIEADLVLLVVFGPAEYTLAAISGRPVEP